MDEPDHRARVVELHLRDQFGGAVAVAFLHGEPREREQERCGHVGGMTAAGGGQEPGGARDGGAAGAERVGRGAQLREAELSPLRGDVFVERVVAPRVGEVEDPQEQGERLITRLLSDRCSTHRLLGRRPRFVEAAQHRETGRSGPEDLGEDPVARRPGVVARAREERFQFRDTHLGRDCRRERTTPTVEPRARRVVGLERARHGDGGLETLGVAPRQPFERDLRRSGRARGSSSSLRATRGATRCNVVSAAPGSS